jgi:hypothetical protein
MTDPMKREIERAIHDAEHPSGMSTHDGMARISAATLRRLHEKCEALTADTIEEMGRIVEIRRLTAQRDALLEVLRFIAGHDLRGADLIVAGHIAHSFIGKARVAIKAVEGEKT